MDDEDMDDARFSRQTLTYGSDTVRCVRALHVRIVADDLSSPFVYECGKNLLLSGVASLHIHARDTTTATTTTERDIARSYAFSTPGRLRLEALLRAFGEISPSVTGSCSLSSAAFSDSSAVIAVGKKGGDAWSTLSRQCRDAGVWFVAVDCDTLEWWQDPGAQHAVRDLDGEPTPDMLVVSAEKESASRLVVAVVVDQLDESLRPGDTVSYRNKTAIVEAVPSVSANQVVLRKAGTGTKEEVVEELVPGVYMRRMPRSGVVHGTVFEGADARASAIAAGAAGPATYAEASYLGGVIAQEVLKAAGTYRPAVGLTACTIERVSGGCGLGRRRKAADQTVFVVGAGALGCELLKGLVMLGFGAGGGRGRIIVTDMDAVAVSNLSRQFLYRTCDVGKPKAPTAAAALRLRRSPLELNIEALTHEVGPATARTVFDAAFWQATDLVVGALDNVAARTYVDDRCKWFRKPLFESGTHGVKGSTQVVLPDLTESYGDSRDPPTRSVPVCVLKQFPYRVEHCVQWACEMFAADDAACYAKWFIDDIVRLRDGRTSDARDPETGGPYWTATRRYPTPLEPAELAPLDRLPAAAAAADAFDKDNAEHARWVWAIACLRCRNFGIPPPTFAQCTAIAGEITPAVASATAATAGLVLMEIERWLGGAPVDAHRNSFFSLADGSAPPVQCAPMPPRYRAGGAPQPDPDMPGCASRTYDGNPLSCWDRLEVSAHTVADLRATLERTYDVTVLGLLDEHGTDWLATAAFSQAPPKSLLLPIGQHLSVDAEDADATIVYFPLILCGGS